MKKKFILFLVVLTFFVSMDIVFASDNLLETQTQNNVIFIKDNDGVFDYSWSFDKQAYNKNYFDFDLGLSYDSPKKNEINAIVGQQIIKKHLSFNYHGNLPSEAKIKINVSDKFKDGDYLYLYYYNEDTNKIEEVETNLKVINGYVTFPITHCSEYFLSLSIVNDASKTNSNNTGVIIIGMIIIVVGLIGFTISNNKK